MNEIKGGLYIERDGGCKAKESCKSELPNTAKAEFRDTLTPTDGIYLLPSGNFGEGQWFGALPESSGSVGVCQNTTVRLCAYVGYFREGNGVLFAIKPRQFERPMFLQPQLRRSSFHLWPRLLRRVDNCQAASTGRCVNSESNMALSGPSPRHYKKIRNI